jgi:hypothetical protein
MASLSPAAADRIGRPGETSFTPVSTYNKVNRKQVNDRAQTRLDEPVKDETCAFDVSLAIIA